MSCTSFSTTAVVPDHAALTLCEKQPICRFPIRAIGPSPLFEQQNYCIQWSGIGSTKHRFQHMEDPLLDRFGAYRHNTPSCWGGWENQPLAGCWWWSRHAFPSPPPVPIQAEGLMAGKAEGQTVPEKLLQAETPWASQMEKWCLPLVNETTQVVYIRLIGKKKITGHHQTGLHKALFEGIKYRARAAPIFEGKLFVERGTTTAATTTTILEGPFDSNASNFGSPIFYNAKRNLVPHCPLCVTDNRPSPTLGYRRCRGYVNLAASR